MLLDNITGKPDLSITTRLNSSSLDHWLCCLYALYHRFHTLLSYLFIDEDNYMNEGGMKIAGLQEGVQKESILRFHLNRGRKEFHVEFSNW